MTRDEALTALANVGITKYRVTGNAAFFETSDGRRAKITAWTDDITSQQVTDLKAELSQMPIDGDSAIRMDIDPRRGIHLDRTEAQARNRRRAERIAARKQRAA